MCCLVTGAAGHLGSHLTQLLVNRGHRVAALVRPSSDLWRLKGVLDRIHLIRSMNEIPANACRTVFHLAWSGITATKRDLPKNIAANISDSLQLFEIAQAAKCETWIGLGSQAEYGHGRDIFHEDLTPKPDTTYGIAKLCLGNLLKVLCSEAGIRFVWLRLTAAYGPMEHSEHLIPSVIESLLAGRGPTLTSNGRQQWDYVYVEDAVEAIYQASISEVQGTFNLAAGHAETVRSIVERIRDMVNPSLPIEFGESSKESLRAESRRLQSATGWRPQTRLDAGLKKTLNWHESIRLHRRSS